MSTIEWTDRTWNFAVGCTAVSPGCDHCYAATVASRQMQPAHQGLTIGRQWNGAVRVLPERFEEPLKWRKPQRVFVGSMTDVFHPKVPTDDLLLMWETMARSPHLTFQVLTKRPKRMATMANAICWRGDDLTTPYLWPDLGDYYPTDDDLDGGGECPLPNVWLGTSVESADYLWRIDALREASAAVRFLSIEPMLAPLGPIDLTGIGWVIVGGESGPGARPMQADWVRDIRNQCQAARVPFFFKQWGSWRPSGGEMVKAPKHADGYNVLDGLTWRQFP